MEVALFDPGSTWLTTTLTADRLYYNGAIYIYEWTCDINWMKAIHANRQMDMEKQDRYTDGYMETDRQKRTDGHTHRDIRDHAHLLTCFAWICRWRQEGEVVGG